MCVCVCVLCVRVCVCASTGRKSSDLQDVEHKASREVRNMDCNIATRSGEDGAVIAGEMVQTCSACRDRHTPDRWTTPTVLMRNIHHMQASVHAACVSVGLHS